VEISNLVHSLMVASPSPPTTNRGFGHMIDLNSQYPLKYLWNG